MSNTMPYVKWHGRDWLGDPLLRMITPEVRGVWIDLLCAMMEADPYGHLAVNGKPMSDEQAARLIGTDIGTYKGCLKVIEESGISSRTADGLLYSRRLVRDHELFLCASNSGRKGGGNPALRMKKNQEARSQKPEAKAGLEVPLKVPLKVSDIEFDQFWRAYPRKTAKKAAFRAWKKAIDKPSIDVVIASVERQKASDQWIKEGGQYIPHPATWLNGGRWEDKPVEAFPQDRPLRHNEASAYPIPENKDKWDGVS